MWPELTIYFILTVTAIIISIERQTNNKNNMDKTGIIKHNVALAFEFRELSIIKHAASSFPLGLVHSEVPAKHNIIPIQVKRKYMLVRGPP